MSIFLGCWSSPKPRYRVSSQPHKVVIGSNELDSAIAGQMWQSLISTGLSDPTLSASANHLADPLADQQGRHARGRHVRPQTKSAVCIGVGSRTPIGVLSP